MVMSGFFAPFGDFLLDSLTIDILTPATPDVNGLTTGQGALTRFVTQPCSLQVVRFRRRGGSVTDEGITGTMPSYICYTAWFAPPVLTAAQTVVVRANGLYFPLLDQLVAGADVGGQAGMVELKLGQPERGR
jgi:hypothetical protein